jgi:tetratricopeptide (TPR) repeat protein
MKQLDPTGNAAGLAVGNHYLQLGDAAMKAKNYPDALKAFDQAAAAGVTQIAVTANTDAAFAILSMDKPDYVKAHDYAMKAASAAPADATAAYAAGITQAGIYATTRKAADKQQALDLLNKADQLAKAAGNTGLSLQIENQIKQLPQ